MRPGDYRPCSFFMIEICTEVDTSEACLQCDYMSTIMAKVFKAGNSRALRLPRTLDIKNKAYEVTPTADGFIVTDPAARARRRRALTQLMKLPPLAGDWPRP